MAARSSDRVRRRRLHRQPGHRDRPPGAARRGVRHGRSRCPGCGEQIAAYDNVPIVSWLVLRGRCRACGEPISAALPAHRGGARACSGRARCSRSAPMTRASSCSAWSSAPSSSRSRSPTSSCGSSRTHSCSPARSPGSRSCSASTSATSTSARSPWPPRAAAFLVIALVYPRGMGMGDAKLVAMMGIYLGRSIAPAVLVGLLAGSIVGVAIDRPPGLRGAQARGPVRPVSRARGCRRPLVRRRHRRLVPGHVHRLDAATPRLGESAA